MHVGNGESLKRILRYLHGTVKHGMLIRRSSGSTLQAFTDVLWKGNPDTSLEAFWAGDSDDRRSTGGFAIYLGSNLIPGTARKKLSSVISSGHHLASKAYVRMTDQNPCRRGRGRGPVTRRGARAMGAGHFNDGIDARDPRDIEIERLQQRVQELELQQEIIEDLPA
ncbi:gag/pol polyprotein [Tanacetum coccineum]